MDELTDTDVSDSAGEVEETVAMTHPSKNANLRLRGFQQLCLSFPLKLHREGALQEAFCEEIVAMKELTAEKKKFSDFYPDQV